MSTDSTNHGGSPSPGQTEHRASANGTATATVVPRDMLTAKGSTTRSCSQRPGPRRGATASAPAVGVGIPTERSDDFGADPPKRLGEILGKRAVPLLAFVVLVLDRG